MIPLCHGMAGWHAWAVFSFLASPLSRESACTYSTKDIHTIGRSARACIELWNGMEPSWEKLSRVECYGQEVTHNLFYYSRIRDGGTVAQHIKKAFNPLYCFQYAVIVLRDTNCQHCLYSFLPAQEQLSASSKNPPHMPSDARFDMLTR